METFKLFFERALGLIEVVEFKELGPVDAKVDSGNGAFNVLHGIDLEEYGDSVNFKTIGGKGLTKKVHDYISINIGAGKVEKRPVVTFDIEFAGKLWKNIPFSISDRSTNEQQVLIGKDFIIKNGGIIDVTKEYNLGEGTQFLFERSGRPPTSQKTIDKIIELRKKRLPLKEIGKILRVHRNTIRKHLPPELKEIDLPRGRIVPQEIKDKIIELRKQKLTTNKIADILKIDRSTVRSSLPQELKDIGLRSTGRPKISQEQINKIVELRRRGLSSGNIGKILGVSTGTIKRYTPPELKNIGLVGGEKKEKITLANNDIQKIARLANIGVSAEDISTLTDIDLRSVLDNMPDNVKKQTPKTTKSSKPAKKVIRPIPKDITSQFVDYLSARNSPTLQTYIDHKLQSSGFIFKNAEQVVNNLKYSDTRIRNFLSELKDLNIKIQNSERQWLNARGVRETISRGAKKAWKTMNTELKQFSNSKEGLQYKQKLIDSGMDERSIEIEMRKEMNRRKQEAAKKGEAFIPDEEFSDIPGKLENRKFEFKAISPYVKRMPETIKVVSLPADYAFEKAFVETFDKNIQSYGFRGNELHKLRTIARKAQEESSGKIIPSGLSHKNINLFLQKPDKYFFSGLNPKESSMRVQTRKPMPTDADIIDLDYLGIPGSMVGSIPMRLNSLHNPFLYPILAAKNCLKSGGLVFVTYTILGPHNMNFFKTDAYKKQNNIFNYRIPTNGPSKLGYFDKNKLPERVKNSMQTAADPQQRYNLSANVANLYLAGILDCAETNNVNLKPVYTNIYSGSPPHVMWRGVFVKQ